MLTCNLWTSKGLVNGAQGIVKKNWFDQGSNTCSHLPAVVFVEFSGYSGPKTPAWEGISPSWVPIVPSVARWELDGRINQGRHSHVPSFHSPWHGESLYTRVRV